MVHEELTFTSLSPAASAFLWGSLPDHWNVTGEPSLTTFLASFAISENVLQAPPISTDITTVNVTKGFSKWRETTTTSPFGRHLGHYKALITNPILLRCLTIVLHITLNKGIALAQWCNAVNVMLEDHGTPNINRLRNIHLFEADYNLPVVLKLLWGSRLVCHAVQLNLLHPCQHGSIPRHTTMDAIMLTQLSTDTLC